MSAQPLGRLFVAAGRTVTALPDPGHVVTGFAEDEKGEPYVLGNTTETLRGRTRMVLALVDGTTTTATAATT